MIENKLPTPYFNSWWKLAFVVGKTIDPSELILYPGWGP